VFVIHLVAYVPRVRPKEVAFIDYDQFDRVEQFRSRSEESSGLFRGGDDDTGFSDQV
jgi:hypothetical protein